MIRCKINIIFLFLLLSSYFLFSNVPPSGVNGVGLRISGGPGLTFYRMFTQHAEYTGQKLSGYASVIKEIRMDKGHRMFLHTGAAYQFYGFNMRSYYFDQDTLRLYDKNFNYNYSISMHEIFLPLHFKMAFNKENNSLYSGYFIAGYDLRYLLPAKVNVDQEGSSVHSSTENIKFKLPLLGYSINSGVCFALGWQKNTINNSRSGFFTELRFRYGFSRLYFHSDYSANSIYFSATQLNLVLGIKF